MKLPSSIRGLLVDLDGTVYLGGNLLPGAREFLLRLRETQRRILFLSNNSSRSRAFYHGRLADLGLATERGEIFTSTSSALIYLSRHHPGARVFALGTPEFEEELRLTGVTLVQERADVVLLAFDKTLTYAKIAAAYGFLEAGATYLATHPDLLCPTEDGFIPDVGCFIALFEKATGRTPKVLGKPAAEMVSCALEALGLEAGEVAMVGDRLYTDIRMARLGGLLSILVLSGETRRADLKKGEDTPDFVVENLGEIGFE
jgi:HAD superfamily hydrolase (TIGR01450 family)